MCYIYIYINISHKLDSNILFFYISALVDEDNDDDDHAYCLKCTTLYGGMHCTCVQCTDCGIYYMNVVSHKCRKKRTFCNNEECRLMIKSCTNLCYVCDVDEINVICRMITPSNQYHAPQCLRCLSNIDNNTACTCKPCSHCKMYFPVDKPHINCRRRTLYCDICDNTIISH